MGQGVAWAAFAAVEPDISLRAKAARYLLFALSVEEVVLTAYGVGGPERARWHALDGVARF
jgi:hypothetical protein